MPARKKKTRNYKSNHPLLLPVLIVGVLIFAFLVTYLSKYRNQIQQLSNQYSSPTCLSVDASVKKIGNVDTLYYNAQISLPFPADNNVECRIKYYYSNPKITYFGAVSFAQPLDLESSSCFGNFPLNKASIKTNSKINLEVIPFNISQSIPGGKCHTAIKLP